MIVFSTVPDENVAKEIAKILVSEGLCACVNVIPKLKSYYIFNDTFCEDDEILLMMKSDLSHYDALEKRIIELHPYDVPEIIATSIDKVSSKYKQWLEKSLS